MPIYLVEVIDYIDVQFEEIYRSWRTDAQVRVYEVEAENEDEARELTEDEEGTLLSEDYEYGDSDHSEWWDTGDILEETFQDREIHVKPNRPEGSQRLTPPSPDWRV